MSEPAAHLIAEDLACRRGERLVFAGLSFSLPQGGALVLTGANGTRLHYVGHLDGIKPALTPRENLAFWAALRGCEPRQAAPALDAALAAFGIEAVADWPCRWLSAGQRRRLALARLLVAPAPIWLLDEPTAALDHDGQERLEQAIIRHRAAGGRVLAATHAPISLDAADTIVLDDFAPHPSAAAAA